MSLMYVVQKREFFVDGERKTKYYPIAKRWEATSRKELIEEMVRNKSLTWSEASTSLDYFFDAVLLFLAQGRSVLLGDLGHLRVTYHSRGSDTPEEVTAKNILGVKLHLVLSKKYQQLLDNLDFEKYPEKGDSASMRKKERALNSARQSGRDEEKYRIAREGLKQGLTAATLSQLTGLAEDEIAALEP